MVFEDCRVGGDCEKAWPILGAAGVCETTGVCACPDGYGGADDWTLRNDCRVDERIQFIAWRISFAGSLIMLCVTSAAVIYLLWHWAWLPLPLMRLCSCCRSCSRTAQLGTRDAGSGSRSGTGVETSAGSGATGTPGARRKQQRLEQRVKEQKRWMLATLLLFVMYGLGASIYFAGLVIGERYRFERVWFLDLGVWMGTVGVLCALWCFFILWFRHLPSLSLYSRLFGVNSILIRRPELIMRSVVLRLVLIPLVSFLVLVVFPYWVADSGDEARRERQDNAVLICFFAMGVDYAVFAIVLCGVLHRLFAELRGASKQLDDATGQSLESRNIRRALRAIRIFGVALAVLGPASGIVFLLIATVPAMRAHMYVSYNVAIGFTVNCVLVVTFICVKYLAGERQMRKLRDDEEVAEIVASREVSAFDLEREEGLRLSA